jgi:hypothetical protein
LAARRVVVLAGVALAVLARFAGVPVVALFLAGADFAVLVAVLLAAALVVVAFFAGVAFAVLARLAGVALLAVLLAVLVVALLAVLLAVLVVALLADLLAVLEAALAGADFAGAALAVFVADAARFAAVLVAPAAALAALVAPPADARPPAAAALGSWRGSATTFLNAVPALNFGTVVFLIFTVSPVRGFRPVRAPRATFWNVPKPVIPTFPPRATSRMITSRTASSASLAAFLLPSLDSRAPMSSALFTISSERLRVGQPPDVDAAGPIPALCRR